MDLSSFFVQPEKAKNVTNIAQSSLMTLMFYSLSIDFAFWNDGVDCEWWCEFGFCPLYILGFTYENGQHAFYWDYSHITWERFENIS